MNLAINPIRPCKRCKSIVWHWVKGLGSAEERCSECSPQERTPAVKDPAWAAKQEDIASKVRPNLTEGQTYVPPKNEGTVGGVFQDERANN